MDGRIVCSKYPPAFGIDLLVDDAQRVELEGHRLGSSVMRIKEDDERWCSRVSSTIIELESRARIASSVEDQLRDAETLPPNIF